ncbi:MAG: winged helix-turn-helix domain-containing protein [Sphingomonas sp.]|nr:winged helix-turn-helix domain-containing protein [Sphingomonas sp.]
MGAKKHDGRVVPRQIVLAHEAPFRIGDVSVEPPTRQMACGERSETIEPRVMQVLVVLGRAHGGIVTRDELIDLCWDGRIVGDDAINRVISRIRHLDDDLGGDNFQVQTIAKVGYRLIASEAERPTATIFTPLGRRKVLFGSMAAGAAAIAGAGAWRAMRGAPAVPQEARQLYDRAEALRATGFAQDNRQAIAYLKRATYIAPDYGSAWGALALAYSNVIAAESPNRVEGFAELRNEAIRQAQKLDPGNVDAALAQAPGHYFGRWAQSERLYGELIRRYPAHYKAHDWLGMLLMDVGRWNDAVGALAAGRARNALSPIIRYRLSVALWSAGRISDADREIDRALEQWPQHGAIWQTKVKFLALTGRPLMALGFMHDPARKPLEEVGEPFATRALFVTALASRAPADAARAVDAMVASVRVDARNAISSAINCSRLGYAELAQDILDGAFLATGQWAELRSRVSIMPPTHPLFQPHASGLWPSARFGALLNRISLERYWASSGRQPDFRRQD